MAQSNRMGPYKWMTLPKNGQRGRCDFGRKAQKDGGMSGFEDRRRRHESKNVGSHNQLKSTRKQKAT